MSLPLYKFSFCRSSMKNFNNKKKKTCLWAQMIYTSNSGPSWLSWVCLGKPWPVSILGTQFHQVGIKTLSNALQPHKSAVSVTVLKAWPITWRSLIRKNKHCFAKLGKIYRKDKFLFHIGNVPSNLLLLNLNLHFSGLW